MRNHGEEVWKILRVMAAKWRPWWKVKGSWGLLSLSNGSVVPLDLRSEPPKAIVQEGTCWVEARRVEVEQEGIKGGKWDEHVMGFFEKVNQIVFSVVQCESFIQFTLWIGVHTSVIEKMGTTFLGKICLVNLIDMGQERVENNGSWSPWIGEELRMQVERLSLKKC